MTDPIEDLLQALRPRAKSLIVTVYGDAILPHGGRIWLGSLIRLMAPFGLNERMVRTAVFRLTQDGTLAATQVGRRSHYGLTETGHHQFESAQRRIYALPETSWDGRWQILMLTRPPTKTQRASLKRELSWIGFAELSPSLYLRPHDGPGAPERIAADHELGDAALLISATADKPDLAGTPRALVAAHWPLDEINARYQEFLEAFEPWGDVTPSDPAATFTLRILLIHAYRRALLRDPSIPGDLLPDGWSGGRAAALCAKIYRTMAGPAESHLLAELEIPDGPTRDPAGELAARFRV